MSVAIARNGMGNWSNVATLSTFRVNSCRNDSRLLPDSAPLKVLNCPSRKPISKANGNCASCSLLRKPMSRRGGESESSVGQLTVVICFSISAGDIPLAYSPPTMAPIDVAAM